MTAEEIRRVLDDLDRRPGPWGVLLDDGTAPHDPAWGLRVRRLISPPGPFVWRSPS